MYYSKIGNIGAGLTNQIFALITSIIIAFINKKKVVVIDNFLNDFKNLSYTPISKIFDISQINIFLQKKYNIIIIDKNNIQFEILSVKYGIDETNYMDLTDLCKTQYNNNNKIFIDLKGCPCDGVIKKIIMKYKINDYYVEEIYHENLKSTIEINFEGAPYVFTLGWINSFNNNMFEEILKNIVYNVDFTSKSELIIKDINTTNTTNKINVIHLRLEEDAITHWSKMNKLTSIEYKAYLEEKYINLFKKYVSEKDENIILSSSLSNGVIDYLNQHNYNYKFINKFFNDREKNAIIDLLVSKCCNNVFIGNFNMKKLNGSTFSYYIWKLMRDDVTKIYIDLDKIYHNEVVINPKI